MRKRDTRARARARRGKRREGGGSKGGRESDGDYCSDAFSCASHLVSREMYVFLAGVIDHE